MKTRRLTTPITRSNEIPGFKRAKIRDPSRLHHISAGLHWEKNVETLQLLRLRMVWWIEECKERENFEAG